MDIRRKNPSIPEIVKTEYLVISYIKNIIISYLKNIYAHNIYSFFDNIKRICEVYSLQHDFRGCV